MAVVLTFVSAAGTVSSSADSGGISSVDAFWVWASLIGLIGGSVLHVAVHELGHWLAAILVGLPVVSVRLGRFELGRPTPALAGTSGHVRVDLTHARRVLPARMTAVLLAGSAANLLVAIPAAVVAASHSVSTGSRTLAVGVTVAGLYAATGNLLPRRPTSDYETDGRQALRWMFRPAEARASAVPRLASAPRPPIALLRESKAALQSRDAVRAQTADPSPAIALAAMTDLLRRRPRYDDGWHEFDVVARFVARRDVPAEARAKVGGQYSLSLALAYVNSLDPGQSTDPASPTVRRIEQLAGLAFAADRESLPARTSLGFVRVIQDQPTEALAVLMDVAGDASPVVRARADAVRGIAEVELGNSDNAYALATLAREMSPNDPMVKLLFAFLPSEERRE